MKSFAGNVPATSIDEAVVCESVQARAWRANFTNRSGGATRETLCSRLSLTTARRLVDVGIGIYLARSQFRVTEGRKGGGVASPCKHIGYRVPHGECKAVKRGSGSKERERRITKYRLSISHGHAGDGESKRQ